jgi:murein DD-endopeptidase MepM/ murein hydrolase activator NlpD
MSTVSDNPVSRKPWTKGDAIGLGEQVGQVGCGGTGPHLHFEIKKASYFSLTEFVSGCAECYYYPDPTNKKAKRRKPPYSLGAVQSYYEKPADPTNSFIQRHHGGIFY